MTCDPRGGRFSLAWWRGRLGPFAIVWLLAASSVLLAPIASNAAGRGPSGVSGGAPGAPPSPKPATPRRPSSSGGARAGNGGALSGRGMWIWYVSRSSGGNIASILDTARTYGIGTLMIKAGDGPTAWTQFAPQLVALLHAHGLKACAWQYVYGTHPIYEAEVGAAAVRAGADCLLIDAESEYQGKYVPAQEYIRKLRQLIGSRFPVGLAGFPYVDYHPGFPYSVFLGPGGAQYNVPQMYWPDIGVSVDDVYAHTYDFNALYQRPIVPLGEVAGDPPPAEVIRFRQMSRAYGANGVSWWDWQSASDRGWRAVGQPVGNLPGFTPQSTMPVLSLRGAGGIWGGDLVVWAQEHLLAAGWPVQVDGSFGAETQTAVEQFQTAHGLPVTGLVDPPTWQAMLRYHPAKIIWSIHRGRTVATAAHTPRAGQTLRLPVPWSARLPARGYEIPRDLGAGHGHEIPRDLGARHRSR